MSRVFFVDRDLGLHIFPDALERAGLAIERHDHHFEPDTPDETWLPDVAGQGWIAVSGDQNILRRPLAIAAIHRSRATLLVVVGNHAPTSELAANFINTMPKIEALLESIEAPAAAKIYRPSPKELVSKGKPGSVKRISLRWPGVFPSEP